MVVVRCNNDRGAAGRTPQVEGELGGWTLCHPGECFRVACGFLKSGRCVRYQIEGVFLVGLLVFLPRHNAVFELQLRAAFAESAAEGNFGWVVIDLGTCIVCRVSIMGMGAIRFSVAGC